MPTLQRSKELYQTRIQGKAERPVAKEERLKNMDAVAKVNRPRRHMAHGATATEIRKALGISKKRLEAARRDLAALGFENKKQ